MLVMQQRLSLFVMQLRSLHWHRYVQEIAPDCAWLMLAPGLRGRLHALDCAADLDGLHSFAAKFCVGQSLQCLVAKVTSATVRFSQLPGVCGVKDPFLG